MKRCYVCNNEVADAEYSELCAEHEDLAIVLIDNNELCSHCSFTDYGDQGVNTHPDSLCEGRFCHQALDMYLDSKKEEE